MAGPCLKPIWRTVTDLTQPENEPKRFEEAAFWVGSARATPVIPRACGVSSTPRPLGSIADASGILDHPSEPVIRPATGRTGWRVMTAWMNFQTAKTVIA